MRALAGAMIEHADELTSLDQAIGDGDHGLNMKRGFEAVLATLPGLADKSLPEMLKAIGMTLVMKVGGASGPLVGTFFMELGKALPDLADDKKTSENKVMGCASQVWLVTHTDGNADNPVMTFEGDSDAHIVRGLVAIVLSIFQRRR